MSLKNLYLVLFSLLICLAIILYVKFTPGDSEKAIFLSEYDLYEDESFKVLCVAQLDANNDIRKLLSEKYRGLHLSNCTLDHLPPLNIEYLQIGNSSISKIDLSKLKNLTELSVNKSRLGLSLNKVSHLKKAWVDQSISKDFIQLNSHCKFYLERN